MLNLLGLVLLATSIFTAPASGKLNLTGDSMPLLELPYGTWRADRYDPDGKLFVFKNIRFGAPPLGDLRWAKPAPPESVIGIQNGTFGPSCQQSSTKGFDFLGPLADWGRIPAAISQFFGGIPIPLFNDGAEDCLFLDVYVPERALSSPTKTKLPVVVWFYGGAFLFGSKDAYQPALPFYDGTGVVRQSGGNIIFVAGNYRMGAYGFLAGSTMEREGLPNAGFYDQRAVLQWVQNHIHLLGGDKTQVSAWGLSSGGGSILHHLVAEGGTLDPLFSKAVVFSPAYELAWDRKGRLEDTFKAFETLAGCKGQGLNCLRKANETTLREANYKLVQMAPDGGFNLGPAADGKYIRQLAPLEFASGNYWKGLQSIVISNVADEAAVFVDGHIRTNKQFTKFVNTIFPSYAKSFGINAAVEAFYPSNSHFFETSRVKDLVRDSSFTCTTRRLTEAYDGKSWNMQYSVTPGYHGTDNVPIFYNVGVDLDILDTNVDFPLIPGMGGLATAYQSYLTSHARTGDPNSHRLVLNLPPTVEWPRPNSTGNEITNVLNVGDLGFSLISDKQNEKRNCDFWVEVAAAVTYAGGYAVPGSHVQQNIVNLGGTVNVSANFG
ncbi:MAG: hypothetical protein M1827_007737 [Pycnora praestabilis]|nr:MAG: hypothetical protein M1827_007737 [Pycnora praestabilis]